MVGGDGAGTFGVVLDSRSEGIMSLVTLLITVAAINLILQYTIGRAEWYVYSH